ncbi:MAG: phosphoglycerate kinase [Bacilli bacterium]|nr:phosphoglycerate kinase [Bacilli bacterium]
MMKKTIRDYDLFGKKVIIRCDFNVPMKDGKIIDDNRLVMSLETINYAINNGAKLILMSHLGRIKAEEDKEKNSLRLVSERLSELLGKNVLFVPTTKGIELENAINSLNNGDVLLMENTRFEDVPGKRESGNDPELGKYWASLGEIFINDAFGTAHRAHASNVGIATNLPSGLGFLVEKEVNALSILNEDIHPYVVILGGSKVADKIGVIENLVTKADKIMIGGGMAYTFLKAKGYNIGTSILDEESIDFCKKIMNEYPEKIVLPLDNIVTKEFSNDVENRNVLVSEFLDDDMGMDIGSNTIDNFCANLDNAKIVFWNGPLGVYEFSKYTNGTERVLEKLVSIDAKTILGGGDIVAAASKLGYKDKVTHASTGGGVTLEFMEGKELPGVVSIMNK